MTAPSTVPADSAEEPCPFQASFALKAIVVDESKRAVAGVRVRLKHAAGTILGSVTTSKGECKFEQLQSGEYHISLYELDQDVWAIASVKQLPDSEANTHGLAKWQTLAADAASEGKMHAVIPGEGVTKIAEGAGLLPETIWSHEKNAALRERRANMDVLHAGEDHLFVPARRVVWRAVQTKNEVTIQRKSASGFLKVRFLDDAQAPRKGVSYLLITKTDDGTPHPDRSGKTDDDGYIDVPIPPRTKTAEVFLNRGVSQETYVFNVGHLDPIDTETGLRARLESLGYAFPTIDGAVRAFQRDHTLEPSGEADTTTREAIQKLYLDTSGTT